MVGWTVVWAGRRNRDNGNDTAVLRNRHLGTTWKIDKRADGRNKGMTEEDP